MNYKNMIAPILILGLAACSNDAPPNTTVAPPDTTVASPSTTIMELMVTRVVPASDTIWGIEEPKTDEEWEVFVAAADEIIAAFEQAEKGGGGPNDAAWAADPKWQAYSDQVIAAAEQTKAAVAARSIEAMWDAGGELYTPCEECHIDFNPGVPGEE